MPNIVFRVPEGLLFGCMEFGWVVGWVGLDKLDPRTTLICCYRGSQRARIIGNIAVVLFMFIVTLILAIIDSSGCTSLYILIVLPNFTLITPNYNYTLSVLDQ